MLMGCYSRSLPACTVEVWIGSHGGPSAIKLPGLQHVDLPARSGKWQQETFWEYDSGSMLDGRC
jgi:hypothetical protein